MGDKIDIYDSNVKTDRELKKFMECESIIKSNRETCAKFFRHCYSDGLGNLRVRKYASLLKKISSVLNKDFYAVNKLDVEDLMIEINKHYASEWSVKDFKITLKKFFKWLRGTENYPIEVSWLKSTMKANKRKLPEELLTEDEIFKLINCASYERDRCLVSLLYETGARIGEIGSLRIKHIVFEANLCKVLLTGKTGTRRVPVLLSRPYLTHWLNIHPSKDDSESPLFTQLRREDKAMTYSALAKVIKESCKRAGIKKRIYPHLFRHSRATILSKNFTESQLKQYLGWSQDSNMASTYIHLSGRDLDTAVLKLNGIEVVEENNGESVLKSVICPQCNAENGGVNNFCYKCGSPLDSKTALTVQNKVEVFKKSDDVSLLALQDGMEKMFERLQELEKKE